MRSVVTSCLVGLACLGTTACQFDPFTSDYTRSRPDDSAVQGVYDFDAESPLPSGERIGAPVHATIDLRADGSFQVANMPDCWLDLIPKGAVDSASGNWRIEQHQEWWAVNLRITKRNDSALDYTLQAMLRRQKPPYLLHIILGDPDSANALVFRPRTAERSNLRVQPTVRFAARG